MPTIMPSYTGSPGADEHATALLQLPQRVGHRDAVVLRDEHAVAPLGHLLGLDRRIVVEHVAHQAGAARERHEIALEADQAARRNAIVEAHAPFAVRLHVLQLTTTGAELFHHRRPGSDLRHPRSGIRTART
jgi:hypothetical protein